MHVVERPAHAREGEKRCGATGPAVGAAVGAAWTGHLARGADLGPGPAWLLLGPASLVRLHPTVLCPPSSPPSLEAQETEARRWKLPAAGASLRAGSVRLPTWTNMQGGGVPR